MIGCDLIADCKGDLEYCEACRQLEEKGPD